MDRNCADGAKAAADDSEHPAEGVARQQRGPSGELDDSQDDQYPTEGVEVIENEPLVVYEDVGVVQSADAVDEVDEPREQQQESCKRDTTGTSHLVLLSGADLRSEHAEPGSLPRAGKGCRHVRGGGRRLNTGARTTRARWRAPLSALDPAGTLPGVPTRGASRCRPSPADRAPPSTTSSRAGASSDLPYYRELARRSGSTLELGAGTGRVALELAGLTDLSVNDADEALLDELVRRAEARSLRVTSVPGDATRLALGRRFDLVLAPASFIQIVGRPRRAAGADARRRAATWRRPAWPWWRSPTWTRSCASARRRRPRSAYTPRDGPSPPGSWPPPRSRAARG